MAPPEADLLDSLAARETFAKGSYPPSSSSQHQYTYEPTDIQRDTHTTYESWAIELLLKESEGANGPTSVRHDKTVQ